MSITVSSPYLPSQAQVHVPVTDQDAFSQVVQALLVSRRNVTLDVQAKADVELETALGTFTIRQVPGEGTVPIKRAYTTYVSFEETCSSSEIMRVRLLHLAL